MAYARHWIPSPNKYNGRRHELDLLVFHYSAGHGNAVALGRVFSSRSVQASSHWGVGRDGEQAQYVDEDNTAWHAGDGLFPLDPAKDSPLADNVNARSIGIEVCNRGWASSKHGRARGEARHRNPRSRARSWEVFPEAQIDSCLELCKEIIARRPTLKYYTGHEDVTNYVTAGGSKLDPGPFWHWRVFANLGLRRVMFNFSTERFEVVT